MKLVAALGFLVLASACGGQGEPWTAVPASPLEPRGFAATSCDSGRMLVSGGSQPTGMPQNQLVAGTAIFDPDSGVWQSIRDPSLPLRERAGALYVHGQHFVWGGSGGLLASDDPSAFEFFSDGAGYSVDSVSWEKLPESPIGLARSPQLVEFEDGFLVVGRNNTPGSNPNPLLNGAYYDVTLAKWTPIQGPDTGGIIVSGATPIAFGPKRVTVLDRTDYMWREIAENPAELTSPDAAVPLGESGFLVLQGPNAWRFDTILGSFGTLPAAPISKASYVAATDVGVVIWDETAPNIALFDSDEGSWRALEIPGRLGSREGTSACAGPTTLTVWGGWRTTTGWIRVAEDSGYVLDLLTVPDREPRGTEEED